MLKALVPVDGSSASERALRHVIALAKGREPMEIHIVNVQDRADAPELRRFLKPAEIKRNQLTHGEAVLAAARKLLDRAGLKYQAHVMIGEPAETIARLARRGKFDKIVMGTHGRTGMSALLMGSVATRVLHRTSVPVTLVK
ncbi:MAG TPA: universal stress protein [Burkholderiales bacterium]|nr:universal stress protein [Burkholderiales bacterium]